MKQVFLFLLMIAMVAVGPVAFSKTSECQSRLLGTAAVVDQRIVKELASLYLTLFVDGEQNAFANDRPRNNAIWKNQIRKTAIELGVDQSVLTEAIGNEVNQSIDQFTVDKQQIATTTDKIQNQQQDLIKNAICKRNKAVVKAIENSLSLPCNEITEDHLSQIKKLEIRYINGALDPIDLHGLTGLVILTMNHSGLTALPSGIFDQLGNLLELDIAWNSGLTALPPGLFDQLKGLLRLDIGNNENLTYLPKGIFDQLVSLEQVYVNDPRSHLIPLFNINILSTIKTNWKNRHLSAAINRLRKRGVHVN